MKPPHRICAGLALFATVVLDAPATAQNLAGRFFYYDAESRADGQWAAQPPLFPQPWQEPDTPHPRRAKIVAEPTAPQGTRVLQWDVTPQVNHDLYTEIKFDQTPPAEPRTYYFAFFVRFDRRDGRDIWHRGRDAESFDKALEVVGDGIRWTVNFGERSMGNQEHRFSVFVTNPTYHLNRDLERVSENYYQNHDVYSRSNSLQLEYERWHAIVFAMKWATDKAGAVALWAKGKKVLEYKDIQTAKPPGTFERLQLWGTIAQPAYDAPPHTRKLDALLFTDDWGLVKRGGYVPDH
ncbi:MAG TPA: heparin lyase I family protein [Candidatus Anammoximicrobium sp.]|nr:heparin lyase I family protein [Candidatus Anammoximicrobium sp.]